MSFFIACDIDHTLLNDKGELLEANITALARAQATGATVILATARSYSGAKLIHDQLELDTPMVVSNGTLVVDPGGMVLMAQTMEPDTARHLVALFQDTPHHWSFRTAEAAFIHPQFDRSRKPFDDPHHYRPTDHYLIEDRTKGYAGLVTASLFGNPLRDFYAAHPWTSFNLIADYYPPSHYTHLETMSVMAETASKGNAVRWLRDYLGLADAPTLTIGDSVADATMFELGIGVAPANSSLPVRAAADWVAPHCDEAAVAAAIEKFVLEGVPTS